MPRRAPDTGDILHCHEHVVESEASLRPARATIAASSIAPSLIAPGTGVAAPSARSAGPRLRVDRVVTVSSLIPQRRARRRRGLRSLPLRSGGHFPALP
jgi:hypothetical protein